MTKTTRKLVISAMLIAFDVIFTRLLAVNVLWAKLGFGFTAVALSAMLWGPAWAGMTAAIADIIGSLLFPTGAYFPGFTATAAITGVIYGAYLHKERPNFVRSLLCALTNSLLVTLLLNTLMILLIFEPSNTAPFLWGRAFEAALMLVAQTAMIYALSCSDNLYNKILSMR